MEILYLSFLVFIASSVGTLTGFGTSTIMVPILTFFLPLPITLLFVGIIHWFGDIWKLMLFSHALKWRLILTFGIPAIAASYLGASLVLSIPETILLRILGIFLVSYTIFSLFKDFSLKTSDSPAVAILGGAFSGFIIGLVGIGGEIRAAFLSAFKLPKDIYLATIGAIAFVTDATRIGAYWLNGVRLPSDLFSSLMILIPVSLLGAIFAKKIVNKISEVLFRRIVLIVLALVGLKLLISP